MKTFRYRTAQRSQRPSAKGFPHIAVDTENLTGAVQGKRATDIEERTGRALAKNGNVEGILFQMDIGARGMPGYRTLDYLVRTRLGYRALEVDGTAFVHRGEAKQAQDRLNDLQRVDGLRKMGVKVREIEHILEPKLTSQSLADQTIKELLG